MRFSIYVLLKLPTISSNNVDFIYAGTTDICIWRY
jgi:hypothetical protein